MDERTVSRHLVTSDADWTGTDDDGSRWKRLGQLAGSTQLGCTLEEIQPGGQPATYHYHLANEEALFVLSGAGIVRTPEGEIAVQTGDYLSFPIGEAGAHAIENRTDSPLRCLFVSTMRDPDIVVYPDEQEFRIQAGAAPGSSTDALTHDLLPFDA